MEKSSSLEQAFDYFAQIDRNEAIKNMSRQNMYHYVLTKYLRTVKDIKPQYHYTDINGFMGIMQNQELWATNTRFLNDINECIEGLLLAQSITREYSEACTTKQKRFLEVFYKVVQERIDRGSNQNIYSISFCEDGDLLSQWRGYGKKGGVAIGFDLTPFEIKYEDKKIFRRFSFMDRHYYESVSLEKRKKDDFVSTDGESRVELRKVIYDKKEQEEILEDLIDIGMEVIEQDKFVGNEEKIVNDILYSFDYLLPIFKNKGFREEREIRYIWRDDSTRKIYFRERNGILIPYIKCMIRDCNCKKIEKFPVKDIIVGPQEKQKEVIDGIKYFLECNEYEYLIDKVRASEIPFRG